MPKTYAQLRNEMEALQRRMEAARKKEGAGALKEVRQLVALYGFTAEDLFGNESKRGAPRKTSSKAQKQDAPKYQDVNGNSWSGRGPRPAWLRAALENGELLESFLTQPPGQSKATGDDAAPAPAKKRRAGVKAAAAKKVTAKKPGRQVKAAGKKARAGGATGDAAASNASAQQGRKRSAASSAAAKPAAKKQRSAKAASARQVAAPTAALEDVGAQAAEA
ncbi:H-NS family nucleoid-associated regulatory protein [Caldimonas brevitalea]|uniref:DNA-binding protein H-NS-like C-terminal domain-containing protein n=1 Tax=Caldimonas brevitalea TaxID=413882 RepID=A0A0G3BCG5_9BURK|nr:H-NS histone family protein [Caldimonas brevitalea]AKJ27059.1 hypothetical protein AAW51_0368 [Caldimonas brevitalea]